MVHALINPKMIHWAIERSGFSASEVSSRLKISVDKLNGFEQGNELLTFSKAKDLAKLANIPFGFLFLKEPPQEPKVQLPDLRTINSQEVSKPSNALKEIVRINQERVDWYREYLILQGYESNKYVSTLSKATVPEAVNFLQKTLDVKRHGDAKEYYRNLTKAIENLHIMVMQGNNLGHHSCPLNIDEFRGFAIADEIAPLIFVNTADSLNAQFFTLIHELTHILKGESGISDNKIQSTHPTEVFCNAVAGEFLVPEKELIIQWNESSQDSIEATFSQLAKTFYVSRNVIARRALTLGLINKKQHDEYNKSLYEEYLLAKDKNRRDNKGGGPSYYLQKNYQISTLLSQAVVSETLAGRVLYRDGGHLLGIKPSKIKTFANKTGMRI